MFKVAQLPAYTWPVTVDFPIDGGKTRAVQFTAKFRRLSQSEVVKQQEEINAGEISDRDIIDAVLIGWAGVADESGVELEFNHDNLDMALEMFPVRPSIVRAYFDSLKNAKQKN